MKTEEKIKIDTDHTLGLELPTISHKARNLFLVPILNNLPKSLLSIAVKTHKAGEEVVKHKTDHAALEILYQNGSTFKSKNIFQHIALRTWFGLDNPRAVRNRLKIVKRELQSRLSYEFEKNKRITLLSIAAGSARAVLESVSNVIEKYPDRHISITFLDKNPAAAEYSNSLAEELNLMENPNIHIVWVTETIGSYMKRINTNDYFNIIEMVGLLDYFDDKKAIEVFTVIKSKLLLGGVFICANINNNRERKFITNFIGWHMIYRTGSELVALLVKSGFKSQSISVVYEPLKIHSITCAYN